MDKDITKIDKNFVLEKQINKDGMNFYNICNKPFKIYGVFMDDGDFCRMPKSIAKTVSDDVYYTNLRTAGGRVKFKTNSKKIAIIAKQTNIGKMSHFAFSGSIGFDLYIKKKDKEIYSGSFIPNIDITDGFERTVYFENDGINEVTINFPLYSGISELFIGIDENCVIKEADEYRIKTPIVYYGSSITQGGCASRPGNSYQAIISRKFDCDYINLGFSGSAKAEDEIIDYIKDLNMSIFVFDYDHNSPSIEHLQSTHEKAFLKIREQNSDLPIIIMSRPKYYLDNKEKQRKEIIKKTYSNAIQNGDKNVFLLDNKLLMNLAKDNGTVDNCHPNDFGFYSISKALEKVIANIIK